MDRRPMPEDYEGRIRALVAQIAALSSDLVLSFDVRAYAVDEFTERLRNARQPAKLLLTWETNIENYADRVNAMARNQRGIHPEDKIVYATDKFVRLQFGLCSELCPPPVGHARDPVRSGSSSSGSTGGLSGG